MPRLALPIFGCRCPVTERTAIILGSGPAAAAAALALTRHGRVRVTVVDIGDRLEPHLEAARTRLAGLPPTAWSVQDIDAITRLPVKSSTKGVPEKRVYGSDYPFRDLGHTARVEAGAGVHQKVVTGAYGGFSSVWGAQLLPFPATTFDGWPVSAKDMSSHYGQVLQHVPLSAVEDDLAAALPLYAVARGALEPSPRAAMALNRYRRHRRRLRHWGLTLGQARLAVEAPACVQCNLCMTGCPYGLIYSAAQTFDQLRSSGSVTYRGGLHAISVCDGLDGGAQVVAREVGSGKTYNFTADRVFVACGAVASTALMLASANDFTTQLSLKEAAQFVLPFASRFSAGDPRTHSAHALGQASGLLNLGKTLAEPIHLQFYTYNAAFLEALPNATRRGALTASLLGRLSVALGYLPAGVSPELTVTATPPDSTGRTGIHVRSSGAADGARQALATMSRRLIKFAPFLDLWPVLPKLEVSAPGKSYHWGGSFPHRLSPSGRYETDTLGRPAGRGRLHIIDASVFPTIASTTFTLTIMANAHRITSETLEAWES